MASLISFRQRIPSSRGAELIEMALVMPLLMMIILGIFDFGFLFREFLVTTNAAREGARVGVLPGYDPDANVIARVQQYMDASNMGVTCGASGSCAVQAAVVCMPGLAAPPCAAGTYKARSVTVTVSHTFKFLGPFAVALPTSVPLKGRAVMRIEQP